MSEPLEEFAARLSAIETEIGKLCLEQGLRVEEVCCVLARMIGIAIRINCAGAAERDKCLVTMYALTRQTMSDAGTRPTWPQ